MSATQADRAQLFDRSSRKRLQNNNINTSTNATAHEAAAIQQSLNRTQQLLQQELKRVSHVSTAIDRDGQLLAQSVTTQRQMEVKQAKQALTSLQRAQQREQQILLASMAFFALVVFYIFWSRVISRLPFVEAIVKLLLQTWLPKIISIIRDYILHPVYKQSSHFYWSVIAPVMPAIKSAVMEPLLQVMRKKEEPQHFEFNPHDVPSAYHTAYSDNFISTTKNKQGDEL